MDLSIQPKVKLLFCIQDFRGRGAERVLATLLKKLNREKYKIGVFVCHDDYTVKIPSDIEIVSAHLTPYLPSAGIWLKVTMNLRKIMAIGKALKDYRPAVTISVSGTNIPVAIAKFLSRGKTKIILSEHTMPSAFIRDSQNRFAGYLIRKLISMTYPSADFIVTPAQKVSDDLRSHYSIPHEKLTVIINPLDVDKIRRDADQEPDFAFPQDQHFRIGFLGGLSKEKNVPCLIRAFADLRKNGFPVRLFLMGQGDEEKNLKHLSVELDVGDFVHFLGYRENPYPILKNLDVLVVPSFYEVFPYVILEAMACRVPVISAKWPGCEGIYEDGENCLLVQVNDHEGLAAAIRRLMEQQDVRRHLTENGLKFIQKCDAAKVMEQYEQLIGKCLRP